MSRVVADVDGVLSRVQKRRAPERSKGVRRNDVRPKVVRPSGKVKCPAVATRALRRNEFDIFDVDDVVVVVVDRVEDAARRVTQRRLDRDARPRVASHRQKTARSLIQFEFVPLKVAQLLGIHGRFPDWTWLETKLEILRKN